MSLRFLTNDVDGAKEDFLESKKLVPSLTQSLVKLASVYMEQGDPTKAFECFDDAIEHNPNDPDIYYHRGQGESPYTSLVDCLLLEVYSSIHHERLRQSSGELHQVNRT